MIDHFQLRNFRSHKSTDVPLAPLTVIVGPNGCGKTSILMGLHLANQVPDDGSLDRQGGRFAYEALARSGEEQFTLTIGGHEPPWSMKLEAQGQGHQWDATVSFTALGIVGEAHNVRNPALLEEGTNPGSLVGSSQYLRLDSKSIGQPTPIASQARLSSDGTGLATVLATLALTAPTVRAGIEEDLTRIVPSFRGLQIKQLLRLGPSEPQPGYSLTLDFAGGENIPAESVSEGTLIALALVTLMRTQSIRPNLILLDDIEQSLHPKAQWELIEMLRRTIDTNPGLQIVATSHSPYLVDDLRPEEVVVCALDKEGATQCAALSSHPKAAEMKGVLSTGEFLSAEGEDWVLERSGD